MTILLELAERVEAASGPDRELDVATHEAIGAPFVMEYWTEADTEPTRNLSHVPRYTASLDAALTLVPEEWHTGAYHQGPSGKPHHWILRTIADGDQRYTEVDAKASTSALALCAAALRARANHPGLVDMGRVG